MSKHWLISFSVPHDEDGLASREKVVEWLAAQLGGMIRETVAVVGPVPKARRDEE